MGFGGLIFLLILLLIHGRGLNVFIISVHGLKFLINVAIKLWVKS